MDMIDINMDVDRNTAGEAYSEDEPHDIEIDVADDNNGDYVEDPELVTADSDSGNDVGSRQEGYFMETDSDDDWAPKRGRGCRKYECEICEKRFLHSRSLTTHMRLHTGEKPFHCAVCKRAFANHFNLKIHMRLHTGEKPFSCDICLRSFTHGNTLKMHRRIHTGEMPYECTVCNKHFARNDGLKRHMAAHTGKKPYNCHICLQSYFQIDSLKMHMEKHSTIKPFECGVCEKKFASIVTLKRHMKNHDEKKFQCGQCENKYIFKAELKRHIAAQHSSERPFKCDICHKGFASSSNLTIHSVTHTEEKPYKCPFCDKRFTQLGNMGAHKRLQHTKERLLPCPECGKMFPRQSALNRHMISHGAEREYICSICSNSFPTPGNLRIHMRRHTGEKPFSCPMCNASFRHQSSMQNHQKTHCVTIFPDTGLNYPPIELYTGPINDKRTDSKNTITHKRKNSKNASMHHDLKCPYCPNDCPDFEQFCSHLSQHPEAAPFLKHVNSLGVCDILISLPNTADNSGEPSSNGKDSNVTEDSVQVKTEPVDLGEHGVPSASAPVSHDEQESSASMATEITTQPPLSRDETLQAPMVFDTDASGKIFKCPICEVASQDALFLHNHMKSHRNLPEDSNQISPQMMVKLFKCPLCPETFTDASLLHVHQKEHHLPPNSPERKTSTVSEISVEAKQELILPQLLKTFPREVGYKRRGKPGTCHICDRSFIYAKSLKKHMLQHEDVRIFVCKVCGKEFYDEKTLKKHVEKHRLWYSGPLPEPVYIEVSQEPVYSKPPPEPVHSEPSPGTVHSEPPPEPVHTEPSPETVHSELPPEPVDQKPLMCQICGSLFGDMNELENHEKSHTNDTTIQETTYLYHSGQHGTDQNSLRLHEISKTNLHEKQECQGTFKSFDVQSSNPTEINVTDLPSSSCLKCEESFEDAPCLQAHETSLLHVHQKEHHLPPNNPARKTSTVSEISVEAKQELILPQLLKTFLHEKQECRGTFKSFDVQSSEPTEINVTDLPSSSCLKCEDSFEDAPSLQAHETLHQEAHSPAVSGPSFKDIQVESESPSGPKITNNVGQQTIFRCSACSQGFGEIGLLKDHLVMHNQAILNQLDNLMTPSITKQQNQA